MLSFFITLKGLLKTHTTHIEGPVFKLHSRWTVLILFSSSILLTCNQFFGDPIHCTGDNLSENEKKALERFCWIHSGFTVPEAFHKPVGIEVPYPGITTHVEGMNKVYHGYYQWVSLFLLLQGVFFYLPNYLWKVWEKGMMKAYSANLQNPLLLEESEKSYKLLSHSLYIHWGHSKMYMIKYLICELLTLVNLEIQMSLLNTFLGGTFTRFGIEVLQFTDQDQEHRTDPLVQAFPRMVKCSFHFFGSSGDVSKLDSFCLLPLNILNEKIVVLLWFWMYVLRIVTILNILYRVLMLCIPLLRFVLLKLKTPLLPANTVERLLSVSSRSDWFMLYMLSKNIETTHYCCVLETLTHMMDRNESTLKRANTETSFL